MKKIKKNCLALFSAVVVSLTFSGCGSSISDSAVEAKFKKLAYEESDKMGDCVKVRSIRTHYGLWFSTVYSLIGKYPECNEVWEIVYSSDKWATKVDCLCRKGNRYFLHLK